MRILSFVKWNLERINFKSIIKRGDFLAPIYKSGTTNMLIFTWLKKSTVYEVIYYHLNHVTLVMVLSDKAT